jgi:hypothetical protein
MMSAPGKPWGKDAVFNHKPVAETKGQAPAVAEDDFYKQAADSTPGHRPL